MNGGSPAQLTITCPPVEIARFRPAGSVPPLERGSVHLWFARLPKLRDRTEELHALLDPSELERAERFRFAADRERFILGHGLLRRLLGRYLDRDPSLIRMARGPYGKPFLDGKDLRFNFSDTKDAILIAFALGTEIGADIETMNRDVDHEAVSEHYFTPPEIKLISSSGTDAKRRFLEFWTRKEAVLKASGVGIMDDLRSLRVDGERNVVPITHDAFLAMAAPEYHVHTWHAGSQHVVSIASPIRVVEAMLWAVDVDAPWTD